MEIFNVSKRKCIYCNKELLTNNEDFHLLCKQEIDQYQSVYNIDSPWITYWVNLLIGRVKINLSDLNFKITLSISTLYAELQNFKYFSTISM